MAMLLMLFGKVDVNLLYTGALLYGFGYAMLTVEPPLMIKTLFGQKDYSAIYSYISTMQAMLGAIAVFIFAGCMI